VTPFVTQLLENPLQRLAWTLKILKGFRMSAASNGAGSLKLSLRPPKRNFGMSKVVALMSMSLDGYVADPDDIVALLLGSGVRLFDHVAGTPAVLGNPTVIAGVGVTHLRCPVRKA
jgi:hypothetical protein